MKQQTVNVLDAADDFERKLNWILFKQEIAHIWDGNEADGDWVPGVPLYNRWAKEYARPMFELIDPERFEARIRIRCYDCDVWWPEPDEPCWMCGKETPYFGGIELKWWQRRRVW